jgi:hypothetical protein
MDLTSPRLMYLKATLLLLTSALSCVLVLLDRPELRTAALLAIAIWSGCRAYYFAFYVVQHYVDPAHRYSGLLAFGRYVLTRRRVSSVHH